MRGWDLFMGMSLIENSPSSPCPSLDGATNRESGAAVGSLRMYRGGGGGVVSGLYLVTVTWPISTWEI